MFSLLHEDQILEGLEHSWKGCWLKMQGIWDSSSIRRKSTEMPRTLGDSLFPRREAAN